MVWQLGWVDLDLWSSPGWWAAAVATYCTNRVVEHPKSKTTKPSLRGHGTPCITKTKTRTHFIDIHPITGWTPGQAFCDTWFLDLTDNTWTKGLDMTTCRKEHTCALLKETNEIVIVAGARRRTNTSCKEVYQSSVEVLDLDTNTIRSSKLQI